MKIMHFIHGLNTGGAETLVKDYILNFNRNKFDLVVLCLEHHGGSPYEELMEDNGVRVIYVEDWLPLKGRTGVFAKAIRLCRKYMIVRKIIRRESPDILHIHLFLCRFVKFARPSHDTKIFYTVHSEPRKMWLESNKKCRKDFSAAKWLVRHYGMRLIVLHEKMRTEVNRLFGVTDAVVLNNGVDIEKYKKVKNKRDIREELKIPKNVFVVGHIGRFSQVKNHEFLVDLFRELKVKKEGAFLLMVGEGELKKVVSAKLREYGLEDSYLILSSRDDVPELMAAMDVFVFPSQYEGLGMALVEAQESKLPCFVSDKVPEYAVISNLVTRLSLSDGAKKWAETILSYHKPERIIVNDTDWNISEITKKLEQIYLDSCPEGNDGKK